MKPSIIAATCCTLWPALALSQVVDGSSQSQIVSVMENVGYVVEAHSDGLLYGADRPDMLAAFGTCSDAGSCSEMMLRVTYRFTPELSYADYSDWHVNWRFGKASLGADGLVNLDWTLDLDGGVSVDNLVDSLDWWDIIREEFEGVMQERGYDIELATGDN